MEELNLMKEEWDMLIILDVCRYDYLEKVYENYFKGKLEKRSSPSSETGEWLRRTFRNKYYRDIIYISGHPGINSKATWGGFTAGKHFHKVIDAWDEGWNEEIQTVDPKYVSEKASRAWKRNPDKRFITHYMQPHSPYIGLDVEWDKDQWAPVLLLKSYLSEGFSFGKFWKVMKSSADWLLMKEVLGKFDRSLKICWKSGDG